LAARWIIHNREDDVAFQDTVKQTYRTALETIEQSGLFKREREIQSPQGAELSVEFPKGSNTRNVLNLCSNNYLGLSNHPRIVRAAHEALDQYGFGLSSVRFICGTQKVHHDLERDLTRFLGTEDTILFSSCFDANAAVFEALLEEHDVLIADRLVHASIIDGMKLSKADVDTFKHADIDHLRKKLESYADRRRKMVITDGVFSMDGDMANLRALVETAEEFGAMVFVDDSHATGFIGPNGRGTHEHHDVMGRIDILSTTFGKALGGASGGCLSGRQELIDLLRQRGRPYLFSNSLAPVIAGTTIEVLKLLQESGDLRRRLHENASWWRSELAAAGFCLKEGTTPIVPVMLFSAKVAQEMSRALYDEGVYAVGFFHPVVAQGQARIRTQLSAAHTPEQLKHARDIFVAVGKRLGILGLTKEELITKFAA
jgi:glycine C-acetyltransferase